MLSNALRARSSLASPGVRVSLIVGILCVVTALGAVALAGTKLGVIVAAVIALAPVAMYVALTSPLVFPFGVFVIFVPFDNLVQIHSFGSVTKLLAICCALALAVKLVLSRRYVTPDKSLVAWVPFLVLAVASLSWAMDPMDGIINVSQLFLFFALYALISFMPVDRKTLGFVITAIIVGGILAGGYGAYVFHHGVNLNEDSRLYVSNGDRSIDPNHFAAALLTPLALALMTFIEARRLSIRAFAIAALGFIGIGVLLSGSRGAMVAIAAMVAYMIWRSRKRVLLIGLSLAGGAVGLAAFGQHLMERFNQVADTGGAGRLGIWKVAWVAFTRHPLLGAGIGNFQNAYNDAYLSVPAFASMRVIEAAKWNVKPHSNLIWAVVELGVLGLAALLFAWWMQFKALRAIPERSQLYPLRVAVEAILIGQFVCGLFLGTLNYKYLWLAFMLAMIVRNAEVVKGGSPREAVVSPVLQTAARRS